MNRPILSQTAPAFPPLGAPARQKVHNRDAIATAPRIAQQSCIFLFANSGRPPVFSLIIDSVDVTEESLQAVALLGLIEPGASRVSAKCLALKETRPAS
jgi:hypothetical protein